MQTERATVTIALLGDIRNTTPRANVTPAEAMVLREIHGPQGVIRIDDTVEDEVDTHELLEYLKTRYVKNLKIVNGLFQGIRPSLPSTFSDAGFDNVISVSMGIPASLPDEEDAPRKRGPGRPSKAELERRAAGAA
jgi:hypothetical protein